MSIVQEFGSNHQLVPSALSVAGQALDRKNMHAAVAAVESKARTYADAVDRVLVRGAGCRVYDEQGRSYLDALACAGALALGHNHPAVIEVVTQYLVSGQLQQALDMTTPAKAEFLDALRSVLPPAWKDRVKFHFCGPSGSDGVEAAIKLLRRVKGRSTIMAFHGGYHGMTAGSQALTGNLNAKRGLSPTQAGVHFLPYPYAYRCPFGLGSAAGESASIEYIERVLRDPESGIERPAAIVLEAVQGEGGVIPAPKAWLSRLREITTELDIGLIIDEVQTGIGRTGTMFAFEDAGIIPDALVLSKAIGGGYPFSILVYDQELDQWTAGAHTGTFRGNQIAMVAGRVVLEQIHSTDLLAKVQLHGKWLQGRWNELQAEFSCIGDIRGRGLMWGLEIVDTHAQPDRLGSFPANGVRAREIRRACLERGLILECGGRHGATLRFLPPLIVSRPELEEALEILRRAIAETEPS